MSCQWKISAPDNSKIERLRAEAGISPLLAWLLINRKIETAAEAQKFLSPQYAHLFENMDLQQFAQAATMILDAVAAGKKIGVHGDYDVDGITATALLIDFFSALGVKLEYFLPHRIDDGYGLRETGIKALEQKGVNFLIAVDCGISDHDAIKRAKDRGWQVLIVDHHRPSEELPPADLIIDPHLKDDGSGLELLCSAGLVFFLLLLLRRGFRDRGLFKDKPEPNLRRSLDLVALGTVADVAPALGLNRILLNYGIKEIAESGRFGLRVLKKRAGVKDDEVGYGQVAFRLAPRLNAAGRINEADLGLELLLCSDPKRANELADELEKRNQLRQRIEVQILNEAQAQVEALPGFAQKKSVVVAGVDWHPGVIGIVAQRLREQFYRPAIAISLHNGVGKGSGRSSAGFDLYSGLTRCSGHLLEFGGHALACGLSLKESELDNFRSAFEKVVAEGSSAEMFEPVLNCDAELPLFKITPDLIDELGKLKPFGPGNPEPLLVARSVTVVDCQVRKERHLWLLLRERDSSMEAWSFWTRFEPLKPGQLIDLAYNIDRSSYQGKVRTRLIIKDLKKLS